MSNTLRNAALPFLPGFTVTDPTKTNFSKSHVFDVRNGVAVFEAGAPGIGGSPLPGQRAVAKRTTRAFATTRGMGEETLPSFIAFDRKVLRFFGYFQEGVNESRLETYRVRRVKIYYYLEDDSIQINESHEDNSGIPQGVLLKRHQVPKPDEPTTHYTFEDLQLGTEITFYGVTYKICDADPFTKNFFQKAGMPIGDPCEFPPNPFEQKMAESRPQPRMTTAPNPEKLALRQFLKNDRQVLRFYAVWDDTETAFGDRRKFVIHYFLSDDTMEVREMFGPNSGYAGFSVFARRQRMPRVLTGLPDPRSSNFVRETELEIGGHINIFNRSFLLYDADPFTKDYYKAKYGKSAADMAPVSLPQQERVLPTREIPPYLGIGSEEDTMGSVTHLFPKPPKKNMQQLMSLDDKIYRFYAKFVDSAPQDAERRFIISAYLGDDTIGVFEPPLRNSGIIGGKFLERRKFKKAGSEEYLKPQDIHVGEVLPLFGHKFLIMDSDDFTINSQLAVRRGGQTAPPITDLISTFPPPPPPAPLRQKALGDPPVVDVRAAMGAIKAALAKAGADPADVVRQCDCGEPKIQISALRRSLLEWGVPMTEDITLALAEEFDPTGTSFMSPEEFLEALKAAPTVATPTPGSTSTRR